MQFLVLDSQGNSIYETVDTFQEAVSSARKFNGSVYAPVDNLMAGLVEDLKAHGEIYAALFVVKKFALDPSLAPVPTGGSGSAAAVDAGSQSTKFEFGQAAPKKSRTKSRR